MCTEKYKKEMGYAWNTKIGQVMRRLLNGQNEGSGHLSTTVLRISWDVPMHLFQSNYNKVYKDFKQDIK